MCLLGCGSVPWEEEEEWQAEGSTSLLARQSFRAVLAARELEKRGGSSRGGRARGTPGAGGPGLGRLAGPEGESRRAVRRAGTPPIAVGVGASRGEVRLGRGADSRLELVFRGCWLLLSHCIWLLLPAWFARGGPEWQGTMPLLVVVTGVGAGAATSGAEEESNVARVRIAASYMDIGAASCFTCCLGVEAKMSQSPPNGMSVPSGCLSVGLSSADLGACSSDKQARPSCA
ncbi:hypothetical protein V8C86DRAFT_2761733 [Haematococcus lacustris]